nr:hypothetical protein [Maliibacterium massiliense]
MAGKRKVPWSVRICTLVMAAALVVIGLRVLRPDVPMGGAIVPVILVILAVVGLIVTAGMMRAQGMGGRNKDGKD